MKKLAALTLSLFLTTGIAFADSPKDTPKKAEAQPATAAKAAVKTNAEIAKELEELRQTLQTQQEQLQLLKDALAKRDREIEDARKAAADASARAAEASSKAADAASGTSEVRTSESSLSTSVNDLKASNDAIKTSLAKQEEAVKKAAEHGPTTIRFKGVNITPGGFIAAETVNRQRAMSADINTPFMRFLMAPTPRASFRK
jgi:predicted RNase H-like nuclease (RuvC/YqgF family)